MAKKKRRYSRKTTIPIALTAGAVAGFIEPAKYLMKGETTSAFRQLTKNYTAIDPVEHYIATGDLKKGLYPLVIGMLVHKGASMFGINRALGRARVPFIRI